MLAGALALVLLLAGAVTAGVLLLGGDDAPSGAADSGPRVPASELATTHVFGCTAPVRSTDNPTGGALERVSCEAYGGHDVVVSTYPDAATARKDGEAVRKASYELDVATGSALLVGPYWTMNCSMRVDCETAQATAGGDLLA